MKRRDLLKTAGFAALTGPLVAAGALLDRGTALAATGKPLMLSFTGPFAFWMNAADPDDPTSANYIRVMAPPVGPQDPVAPHQPWVGTTATDARLPCTSNPSYKLCMSVTPNPSPQVAGPPAPEILDFPQTQVQLGPQAQVTPQVQVTPVAAAPLLCLYVPAPDVIVGLLAADVYLGECGVNPDPWKSVATSAIFLYNQVSLGDPITIQDCNNPAGFTFNADFSIDLAAPLPCATLGVHMTPLFGCDPNQGDDTDHVHAQTVTDRMRSMFPGIETVYFAAPCGNVAIGDDCKAPIMKLS